MTAIKNSFRNRLLAGMIAMAALLSSCEKFLDAPSPLLVNQEEVFSTEKGFQEAMNGVYLQMGSTSLYGRELSIGLLSILGRSYDTTITPKAGSLYYEGARYNFGDPEVKNAINTIWDSSYQCIANLNNLLGQIDDKKELFTGNNYNQVKGEALALRAFLHFDLLRLFGPAAAQSYPAAPGIPYVKVLSAYAVPSLTTGEVLDACIKDLETSLELITNPAKVQGHFDYWSTRAFLARVYLNQGSLSKAAAMAQEVIDSKKFPQVISNSDLLFVQEHVLTLFVSPGNQNNYYKSFFNTPSPMGLLPANQNQLYLSGSGSSSDWRKAFVDPATNLPTNATNPNAVVMPRKFIVSNNNVVPMIRLNEMFYIAAECAMENNDLTRATELLDSVRVHRNLPVYTIPALPADSISVEIEKEYRKEMLGEGQVFFYFKRKNKPFDQLPFTKVPVVANATYSFPKPE